VSQETHRPECGDVQKRLGGCFQQTATLSGVLADGTPFSFTLDEFFPGPDLFSPFGTLTLTHATQVPEPSTLLLGVMGLVGFALLARRTRRS
jgi:hypothetical protein